MLYWFARGVIRAVGLIFFGWRIEGEENIPTSGGVILAANHVSLMDPFFCGSAIRRKVHFMAKIEIFRNAFVGRLARAVGAFPVNRGAADRAAIRESLRLLAAGEVLGIFPEGTRSADGGLQKPQTGIALLAKMSQAPVIPMAVLGTERILPKGAKFPHFARITIRIGPPVTLPPSSVALSEREQLQELAERVMAAIGVLAVGPGAANRG